MLPPHPHAVPSKRRSKLGDRLAEAEQERSPVVLMYPW